MLQQLLIAPPEMLADMIALLRTSQPLLQPNNNVGQPLPPVGLVLSPDGSAVLMLDSPNTTGHLPASSDSARQLLALFNGEGQDLALAGGAKQLLTASPCSVGGSASISGLGSALIQPGECSRLKRPLDQASPSSSVAKRSKGSGHHSTRKGYFTGQHKGVTRAPFLSLAEPVDTPEEISLFHTLSQDHQIKKGDDLDFVIMARKWNEEVVRLMQQAQEAGMQGVTIRPKTEKQLRYFHKDLSQALCGRRSAGVTEALNGVAAAASPSMAPSVQACLGVIQSMVAMVKPLKPMLGPSTSIPKAAPALHTASTSTRRLFPSVAKKNKINNQGGGSKKCMCGWRAAADGIGLGAHRKKCEPYMSMHPNNKKKS